MRKAPRVVLIAFVGALVGRDVLGTALGADRLGIHTTDRLLHGGAQLYVEVRGDDRRAPVLIWLHGGPGAPERPLFRYFNSALEHDFTVVNWDQRGTARSFDARADPVHLTVDQHVEDLDVVVAHVRRALGRDRVFIVGHSWGGTLGLLYAHAHPEHVAGIVAVAPDVAPAEAQRRQYAFVSSEAARLDDLRALRRLETLGSAPYRSAKALLAVDGLAERYGAVFHRRPHQFWILFSGMARGLVRPWELPRYFQANSASLQAMNAELLDLDLRTTVPSVEVPVVFMLGRFDRHVDATLASSYYDELKAPSKRLVWFEDSAHNPPFEEAAAFNAAVVTQLAAIPSARP